MSFVARLAVVLPGAAVAGPVLIAVSLAAGRRVVDLLDRRRRPAPVDPEPDTPLPWYPPLPPAPTMADTVVLDGVIVDPRPSTALVRLADVEAVAALVAVVPPHHWYLTDHYRPQEWEPARTAYALLAEQEWPTGVGEVVAS